MTCIVCELDKYDGDQNKEGAIWQSLGIRNTSVRREQSTDHHS